MCLIVTVGRTVLTENFWEAGPLERVHCRAPENTRSRKRMKSAASYATVVSVQGHRCLLIELKLCEMITCIWQNWGLGEH